MKKVMKKKVKKEKRRHFLMLSLIAIVFDHSENLFIFTVLIYKLKQKK